MTPTEEDILIGQKYADKLVQKMNEHVANEKVKLEKTDFSAEVGGVTAYTNILKGIVKIEFSDDSLLDKEKLAESTVVAVTNAILKANEYYLEYSANIERKREEFIQELVGEILEEANKLAMKAPDVTPTLKGLN